MTTITGTRFGSTFLGTPAQVGRVRAKMRTWLGDCPRADDAILIASELAANAVQHSASRGESFTVRAEVDRDGIHLEVEDLGGPWLRREQEDGHRGLAIVAALASSWGVETSAGCRVCWARIGFHG